MIIMIVMNSVHNQIDLNLLHIFEAVMMELNVSRAAERLNMTQPAVSHALRRLRRITNDDLFLKVPSGVSPTPKALELWEPIREGLIHIRQALSPPAFEPAASTQTFTLAAADYTVALFLPKLLPILAQTAPQINIRIVPNTNINAAKLLEQSEIDLAIGRFYRSTLRLRVQEVMCDRYVCIMRKDHPLARKKLTLKQYIKVNHILVTLTGEATGFIDEQLREIDLSRRIALTVNQFTLVPELVAGSDLISAMPSRMVERSPFQANLHITELPIKIAPAFLQIMWHERKQIDPAHEWMRAHLIAIAQELPTVSTL
ncbi:PCP degradation transcriptional activation protein [Acaryochloris thomasi RCC1774]|uniref:PCP degradation transcriptional activation protein n=1 Tax=Acaryochloris thomasi RCC1774 TaxID=1764569 RepID=A0A2W1JIB4_9CYAN|nr:LysR family transcriptional regulator [Acaryochloris thomasi]PZD73239.1 PCP degradation transcriptional activation protein [Acaryochloris thomasi RCC1774]